MCFKALRWSLALELLLLPHCFLDTSIQETRFLSPEERNLQETKLSQQGKVCFYRRAGDGNSERLECSGNNVTLGIPRLPPNVEYLTWFYTNNQKILDWTFNESRPIYYRNKFKDRVTLDLQSGKLQIYKVQREDSSTYLLRVLGKDACENNWEIPLKVLDPVPQPAIRIENIQVENNTCSLALLCCVIRSQSVSYTWYGDSGPLPEQLQSSVLNITITPENYSTFYTCQVSNPACSKNHTVYFTALCQPARSSGVAWIATLLVVMAPTLLCFLLT